MYDFNELLLTIFFISLLDLIIFIYIMMWVIRHSVRNALEDVLLSDEFKNAMAISALRAIEQADAQSKQSENENDR